jgi:hypothetical protein
MIDVLNEEKHYNHQVDPRRCVLQDWVLGIPLMQQTVLLTAIRGPDGLPKYNGIKMLLRWYRRCVLLSALDGKVLSTPYEKNGGSFTGPSFTHELDAPWQSYMDEIVSDYLKSLDGIPHHFQMHLLHAIEIVGYKHSDLEIRAWWCSVYKRLVNDFHLHPETCEELDTRLGDTREGWLKRADRATIA